MSSSWQLQIKLLLWPNVSVGKSPGLAQLGHRQDEFAWTVPKWSDRCTPLPDTSRRSSQYLVMSVQFAFSPLRQSNMAPRCGFTCISLGGDGCCQHLSLRFHRPIRCILSSSLFPATYPLLIRLLHMFFPGWTGLVTFLTAF